MISIKANCIDSTNPPEVVFQNEVQRLKEEGLSPKEQMTLEPYERDHAIVIGDFRNPDDQESKKKKKMSGINSNYFFLFKP